MLLLNPSSSIPTVIETDYLIVGSGIIGLAMAKELKKQNPDRSIHIIEKELQQALHASGRNSGVLHAGFYYTCDSLKARFTKDGNQELTEFCHQHDIKVNQCGKVVVATDENQLEGLYELEHRARLNGVEGWIVDSKDLANIDPNIKTCQRALYSPKTSTLNPSEVCLKLRHILEAQGVRFHFSHKYLRSKVSSRGEEVSVWTDTGFIFKARHFINCAGLYADQVAKDLGFSMDLTILPFKGLYLKSSLPLSHFKTNIYPVPNLKNPFLGVHFTLTVNGEVKIGPTAIPAFWRENYQGFSRFKWKEIFEILGLESRLFFQNTFNFRDLAYEEMKKYQRSHLMGLASKMVYKLDASSFNHWSNPGIRAQLLDLKRMELVQDYVVQGDKASTHILNAVSPSFTSCFPFVRWVHSKMIENGAH